jgi:hypothetical protein
MQAHSMASGMTLLARSSHGNCMAWPFGVAGMAHCVYDGGGVEAHSMVSDMTLLARSSHGDRAVTVCHSESDTYYWPCQWCEFPGHDFPGNIIPW